MSHEELMMMGHERMTAQKAIRANCLECANGSAHEVRFCTDVICPLWPFRMGRNPWRPPLSEETRERKAQQLKQNLGVP